MSERRVVYLEGLSPDELLAWAPAELEQLILGGEPLVFRAGTAEVLGRFEVQGPRLVVELAQVDGGGEGVLPTLWSVAERYARAQGLAEVEWIVHALRCARPNLKLRRVLVRRGFVVEEVEGAGEVYRLVQALSE